MSHHTIDYASLIHEKGFRLTWQREKVLDAVCEAGEHVSADEVCARVMAKSPEIDRSTIYRSLDFLVEMRLICASLIDGDRRYEIAIGAPHHHHLICRVCGTELEIPENHLTALADDIRDAYGFSIEADHLILQGTCANCNEKKTESSTH